MRLLSLRIDNYKNLRNFFFEDFGTEGADMTTVFIGQNGSGKSNLFEALAKIFRSFDYPSKSYISFFYNIEMLINGQKIMVIGEPRNTGYNVSFCIWKNVEYKVTSKDILKRQGHLPMHVFAYYSGESDRMEKEFRQHRLKHRQNLYSNKKVGLRSLFKIKRHHAWINLVTSQVFFANRKHKQNSILKTLDIHTIRELRIRLGKPHKFVVANLKTGHEGFWGVHHDVDNLMTELEAVEVGRKTSSHRFTVNGEAQVFEFYDELVLDDEGLSLLAQRYPDGPIELYKAFLDAIDVGLIKNVSMRLEDRLGNEFPYQDLSEGEKQLLVVYGLVKFTQTSNSLFLLDEPDTHLNPRWKYDFLHDLNKLVRPENKDNVQVLLATHDPLMISGLKKDNVLLVKNRIDDSVVLEPAEEDILGKSVESILTSKLFGLNFTMDRESAAKMIDRRILLAKREKQGLTEIELKRLQQLSEYLAEMDFNIPFHDPIYKHYVLALGKLDRFKDPFITENEETRRQGLADRILKDLMGE